MCVTHSTATESSLLSDTLSGKDAVEVLDATEQKEQRDIAPFVPSALKMGLSKDHDDISTWDEIVVRKK